MRYGPLEINGKSAGITGKNTEGGGGGGGGWGGCNSKGKLRQERTSQKRKFSGGGGGRIGKFDQEGRWSEKKSPDLRSPEVGISDTHCGISRVGMLSSLYQHVVE